MEETRDIEKALSPVLLHCGVDLRTIADISGHDVATMLKHYAHSMSASRQDTISQLPTLHLVGAENDKISNNSKGNNEYIVSYISRVTGSMDHCLVIAKLLNLVHTTIRRYRLFPEATKDIHEYFT